MASLVNNHERDIDERLNDIELRLSELELQGLQGGVYANPSGKEQSLRDALTWLERMTPVVRRLYWAIKEAAPKFDGPDRTALDQAVGTLDAWQSAHTRLHETLAETNARELDLTSQSERQGPQ